MRKFSAIVPEACPFHSASEQAKTWDRTCVLLICVTDDGRVFKKSAAPSEIYRGIRKWKEVNVTHRGSSVEKYLSQLEAVPAKFRGGPK